MDDDERLVAQSIADEFRQALADTQFLLAKANALGKVKDRRMAELIQELESARAPSGPRGPTGDAAQPKPGPPPAS